MPGNLWTRLKALLETNPAALLYGLAAILPPVLYALGVSKGYAGAVVTIVTAAAAILTAVKARPVAVPVILGAAGSLLSAFTVFGLHLTPQATTEILTALQIALAFLLHLSLTPLASMPRVVMSVTAAPGTSNPLGADGDLAKRKPGASLSGEHRERLAGL